METYSKDIVKKLLQRATQKITIEKDNRIKELETELEAIKLEKDLNSEYNIKEKEASVNETDIDKILGGLNE